MWVRQDGTLTCDGWVFSLGQKLLQLVDVEVGNTDALYQALVDKLSDQPESGLL